MGGGGDSGSLKLICLWGKNPLFEREYVKMCRERKRTARDLHDYGNAIPSLETDESAANDGMNADVDVGRGAWVYSYI